MSAPHLPARTPQPGLSESKETRVTATSRSASALRSVARSSLIIERMMSAKLDWNFFGISSDIIEPGVFGG
jgi:hypothetical protein